MRNQQLLERIVLNPKVMIGKPVIKGTRLTVEFIVNLLAHGATIEEILDEYEGLMAATYRMAQTLFIFRPKEVLKEFTKRRCDKAIGQKCGMTQNVVNGR